MSCRTAAFSYLPEGFGSRIIRVCAPVAPAVATLLLATAAIAKAATPQGSRSLAILEMGLAVWLAAGVARRMASLAVGFLFGAFTVYNVGLVVAGASSCGCFGQATFPPAVLAVIDLIVCVGLLTGAGLVPNVRTRLPVVLSLVALLISASITLLSSDGESLRGCRDIATIHRLGLLENPKLLRELGLNLDASDGQGSLVYLVVNHSCEDCRNFLEEIASHAHAWRDELEVTVLAVDGPGEKLKLSGPHPFHQSSLPRCSVWTDRVPCVLIVNNGISGSVMAQVVSPATVPLLAVQLEGVAARLRRHS